MILVTGATGNAGSQVVRALAERGEAVRCFARDSEKARRLLGDAVELAVGDFADEDSFYGALEGVDRLVLSCADDPRRVEWETAAIDAAAAAGVRRIVRLSTIGAEPGAAVAFWDWHGQIDRHLRSCGVAWVVLQSSFYMTNLLAAAEQVAHEGRIFAPAGTARVAMIDPRDVGAAAASVLVDGRHDGEALVLTGPEAITYQQAAAALSDAAGRPVEFVDVPADAARHALVESGLPEFVAEQIVAIFGELRNGVASEVTTAVDALTGRPPRSFTQFARDHARVFAAAPVEA